MIEELRKSHHKRQKLHHLILLPCLMEPQWRKVVYKAANIVLSLPAGHVAWPKEMFEPLTQIPVEGLSTRQKDIIRYVTNSNT
jgi:hypothetical protein